ncbi:MAG: helix-turn-helix domain-containing protein [Devosia sp.]|uniref:helix-turn-helix domain-containing protein n=1 Tax=Devosia sp. TaxID=1871048 RepID=UPI0019F23CBD|nr:AraC family transcriptional regulator [Devosia sp.]MBF0679408.1 helix-turn-helix domain-containing protein [Devosia sp.]
MKPYLEKLAAADGASWAMLNRRLPEGIPFQWHHHPEMELTLTLNSRGQRFIGDHAAPYDHDDLILVGGNLPHTWASTEAIDPTQPHVALVLWFGPDWLEQMAANSVELAPLRDLITRARHGLHFPAATASALRQRYEALFDQPPEQRLFSLLDLLLTLARDRDATALSTSSAAPADQTSRARIDRVLAHIHAHHAELIRLDTLADLAALSASGLHRMFLKHTQTTISQYLIRLRIADACARLSSTDQPIQHIANSVGYASLANFNRHFQTLRGMTPRAYRGRFRG